MAQKSLPLNLFSFFIVREEEEKFGGYLSEMTLGYIDDKKFEGELNWNPILFKYMFGIKLDGIKVNNQFLDIGCDKKDCLVTIDSGTSHLAFPTFAYSKLKGVLPLRDQGVPCSNSEQFGSLTYVIGGKDYAIPNNEWTFEPESASKVYKETNK